MEAVRPGPDRTAPTRVQLLNDAARWRSEGAGRKRAARRAGRCVECGGALRSRRSPYCSPRCRWNFHGRFFWDAARVVVLRRDRYTCRICRQRFRARELEVDHVIELAAGGEPLDYANLQAVCRPCHRRKTAGFVRWWSVQRDTPSDSELSPGGRDVVRWESEWFPA